MGSIIDRDYIRSNQLTIGGAREIIGFGEKEFFVREILPDLAKQTVIQNHYSGKITDHSYIHLGVFVRNPLWRGREMVVGVLQFGYAMNPASCGNVVADTAMDQYLELNRMWIHDIMGRNTESRALSYAIKYIRGKYRKVKWIQSFADERCGKLGVVYQAANFKYYGSHKMWFWELDGMFYHRAIMNNANDTSFQARRLRQEKDRAIRHDMRQHRYIFFIDQRSIAKCKWKLRPYPKHYAIN